MSRFTEAMKPVLGYGPTYKVVFQWFCLKDGLNEGEFEGS